MTAASERRASSISEPRVRPVPRSATRRRRATAAGTMRSKPTAPSPTGQNERSPRTRKSLTCSSGPRPSNDMGSTPAYQAQPASSSRKTPGAGGRGSPARPRRRGCGTRARGRARRPPGRRGDARERRGVELGGSTQLITRRRQPSTSASAASSASSSRSSRERVPRRPRRARAPAASRPRGAGSWPCRSNSSTPS